MNYADHYFAPLRLRNGKYVVVAAESRWKRPLQWDRHAATAGTRNMVEVSYDVFEDWRGPMVNSSGHILGKNYHPCDASTTWKRLAMQDVRSRLFALIDSTPNLDWLLLTKRPENVAGMMPACGRCDGDGKAHGSDRPFEWRGPGTYPGPCPVCKSRPRPNVWLGVSVENQKAADERIPHLLRTPAAVRFLSCEPLLGPVDLRQHLLAPITTGHRWCDSRAWVIVGGESGPKARPCGMTWFRSIVEQCRAAGVACFVKQLGSNPEFARGENVRWADAGPTQRLRDRKGGDPEEWPADLRVRELP